MMLSRTVYDTESGKPIQFSQDFFRGDYARIQMEFNLQSGQESAPRQVASDANHPEPGKEEQGREAIVENLQ
jgi:hypothetical protein